MARQERIARDPCENVSFALPTRDARRLSTHAARVGVTRSSIIRALVMGFLERVENEGIENLPLYPVVRRCVLPTDAEDQRIAAREHARALRELRALHEEEVAEQCLVAAEPDREAERIATLKRLWSEAGMSDEDMARALADDDPLV